MGRQDTCPWLLVAARDDQGRIGARRDVVQLAGRVARVDGHDDRPRLVCGDVRDREPVGEVGREQEHHAVAGAHASVDKGPGQGVRPRVPLRERHRFTADDVDRDPLREPFCDCLQLVREQGHFRTVLT